MTTIAPDDTFICALCHETFEKGWTDEEAKVEANELWNAQEQASGMDTICENCFQRFMAGLQT